MLSVCSVTRWLLTVGYASWLMDRVDERVAERQHALLVKPLWGLPLPTNHRSWPIERAWPGILRQADNAVAKDSVAGFTTLVCLCVYQGRVVGVSSGDSAALLISSAQPNELTAGQKKNPPVGSGAAVAVPFEAQVEEPWRVLLMSDGVWKYVGWERVIEVAGRAAGSSVIPELQQLACLPGSGRFQDDFTVVMLESPTESAFQQTNPGGHATE